VTPTNDENIEIGASKMGGCPDLPADINWPSWHEPMAFIGQFNLAAVSPYDREALLPSQGLLSFFYETDGEPGYSAKLDMGPGAFSKEASEAIRRFWYEKRSSGWKVLFYDGRLEVLRRRSVDKRLNEKSLFTPCSVSFVSIMTLPYANGPEIWELQP